MASVSQANTDLHDLNSDNKVMVRWCTTFSNYSSLHGVNWFTFFDKRPIKFLILSISMLIFVALPIFLVIELLQFLDTTQTVNSVSQISNTTMAYPTITVCNPLFFDRNKSVTKYNFTEEMGTYLILSLNPTLVDLIKIMPTVNPFFADTYNNMLSSLELELDQALETSGLGYIELLKDIAIRCVDFVQYCEFHLTYFMDTTCCEKLFKPEPIFSHRGVCYSTRDDIVELFPSSMSFLSMLLAVKRDNAFKFSLALGGSSVLETMGVSYVLTNQNHPIYQITQGSHKVSIGQSSSVGITVKETDRRGLNANFLVPVERRCVEDTDEYDLGGLAYTKLNCVANITQRLIPGCSLAQVMGINSSKTLLRPCLPKDIVKAPQSFAEMVQIGAEANTFCRSECRERTFQTVISTTTIDMDTLRHFWDQYGTKHMEHVSLLNFYFESFDFDVEEISQRTLLEFLSQVGGWMGLAIGASLVSFIELIFFIGYFFITWLQKCIRCLSTD